MIKSIFSPNILLKVLLNIYGRRFLFIRNTENDDNNCYPERLKEANIFCPPFNALHKPTNLSKWHNFRGERLSFFTQRFTGIGIFKTGLIGLVG